MSVKMIFPGVYEFNPDLDDEHDDFEKHQRLLANSGMPNRYFHECRFSLFEMIPGREEGFEAACKLVRGEIDPPLLLLYGLPGRSKTHLAASIGFCFMAQLDSVLYYHVGDLLDDLRAGMRVERMLSPIDMAGATNSASRIIQRCKTVRLLILDDMGLGGETDWAWEKLDTIVNHRYDAYLPTVITANTLEVSDRIRDRCRQGLVVRLEGESYRELLAKRKKECQK